MAPDALALKVREMCYVRYRCCISPSTSFRCILFARRDLAYINRQACEQLWSFTA